MAGRKSRYWDIVQFIRENGPMSIVNAAIGIGCSSTAANMASRKARQDGLLKIIGKDEYQRFILAAVQTRDWPAQYQQQRAA